MNVVITFGARHWCGDSSFCLPNRALTWPWWDSLCAESPLDTPSTSRRDTSQSHRCTAIVQAGITHLQWKVWFPPLPPPFPQFLKTSWLLWKQCWADAIKAEALETVCWWSFSGSVTAWLMPAVESGHGRAGNKEQESRKPHGADRCQGGKD